jgi:hypothetical protein
MAINDPLGAADLTVCVASPQSQRVAGAAEQAVQGAAAPSRVAMIICHGMGQQVAFETLDCVAKSLLGAEAESRRRAENTSPSGGDKQHRSAVDVKIVRLGSEQLPRAELTVTTPTGPREVHLYEAYWAPLTEGKVSALDVSRFLLDAWKRGMRFAAAGRFTRFIFGEERVFRLPRSNMLQLTIAFLAILLAWALFFAVWLAPAGLAWSAWTGALAPSLLAGAAVLWLVPAYYSFRARELYFQYAGDVAAYVASHKVNRFYEVRAAIKKVGLDLARAVYGARAADGGEEYREVYVVGHSLGSVVAYDTLNAMLNEDQLGGGGLRVRDRTPLLLTFGSPLDKTAFIFRTQLKDAPVREALAAAMQPMIQSYDQRPNHWVNIHSPFDPVSGPLSFYDTPDHADASLPSRRVMNLRDPAANKPLAAHVQYWNNPLLGTTLHRVISGLPPVLAAQTAAQARPGTVDGAGAAKIAGA